MIILTTFFFLFAIVCAKNIRYGIYAVIFSMPLYLIRFPIFGIPTTVLEIMIYILFLAWVLNEIVFLPRCSLSAEPACRTGRDCSGLRVFSSQSSAERLRRSMNNFYPALAEGSNGFSRFRKNNSILLIGIALLFLGLVLSTLHSADLRTSLGICKGWFFDPFLFFIVFVSVIKKTEHIKLSLASWVFSGTVVSLISIAYLLSNTLTFDNRLSAFYISPNYLAMYLAPVFLIVLFFLLYNKKVSSIKYQVVSIIILTIILIPLFFTYSYGAFLGMFAGVAWLFYKTRTCHSDRSARGTSKRSGGICERIRCVFRVVFKSKYNCVYRFLHSIPLLSSFHSSRNDKNGRVLTQPFLKILTLIILVVFISITAVKFNQIANSESRSSLHSRLMIWNASMEIIKDNPVFGIGPGTFQEVYLSYSEKFDEPYLEWAVTQPHNTFLAFYLQTGLIGFIGFILILLWFFSCCRDEAVPRLYRQVISILIVYILVHGLVDTMYWKNDLSLMFWLIIGLLLTTSKNCAMMTSQDKKG